MLSNEYEATVPTRSVSDERLAPYLDEATLHSDVTVDTEINSVGDYVLLTKRGPSMVQFFRWRMTRLQRLCLIIVLLLFLALIAMLPTVFAFTTAMIKHKMDKVVLSINYVDVTNLSNHSMLDVTFSVNLQHNVPISVSIDNTTASLVYSGMKVGNLNMGALTLKSGSQNYNVTIETTLTISDTTGFRAFTKAIVQDKTIPFTVQAELDALAMGLPFNNLNFERTLSVIGFNKFQNLGFKLHQIDVSGCNNPHGVYQMDLNTSVNNLSTIGLQGIGTLNLSLYENTSYLGYASSELRLPRGPSHQSLHMVLPKQTAAVEAMKARLRTGRFEVHVRGDNPYATEHIQFKDALDTVDMTIKSVNALTHIGEVVTGTWQTANQVKKERGTVKVAQLLPHVQESSQSGQMELKPAALALARVARAV
ncbi:hypothetical protein PsorP6_005496 [Peronosclerospora sorghi]|uniref:Uncharacterized protein n=1 Tax=Peronosclerospora sorghi TaxID=230839 RepID=A0ACC0W0M1_9STRA|nr:hypothetical protein PsorP6_005496 [Peronosclerospora sorghi]